MDFGLVLWTVALVLTVVGLISVLRSRTVRGGLIEPDGMSGSDLVVFVTDQIQDFVVEELAASNRSSAWPECPHHPGTHPLRPVLDAGRARWSCHVLGQVVADIGELGDAKSA